MLDMMMIVCGLKFPLLVSIFCCFRLIQKRLGNIHWKWSFLCASNTSFKHNDHTLAFYNVFFFKHMLKQGWLYPENAQRMRSELTKHEEVMTCCVCVCFLPFAHPIVIFHTHIRLSMIKTSVWSTIL